MDSEVHVLDYILFAAMLIVSTGIGVYHGCTGGKNRSNEEFLMANRSMGVFPVTCSMIATYISAILVLGTPAEVFSRGTAYPVYIAVALIVAAVCTAFIFVPVMFNLRLVSIYEYLEIRYQHHLPRIVGSFLFCLETALYLGIALYAPATAVEAVMGIDLWISLVCVGGLCTFYTSFGGMKAVMWTDVFQIVTVLTGLVAVLVVVSIKFGGFSAIWEYADHGGRIDWGNVEAIATDYTVWSMLLGNWVMWFARYAANQSGSQRFLTMRSVREAQIATMLNAPGAGFLFLLAGSCGIAIYRVYGNCDPLLTGDIENGNQYMPKMIKEVLALPGLTGLFVATLFAGALSTVSSGLNSIAAVIWTDVLARYCSRSVTQHSAAVTKGLAAAFGVFGVALAFIVQFLGSNVVQATFSVIGITTGPSLGLFLLGLLTTRANWLGATAGALFALCITGWLSVGKFIYAVPDINLNTTVTNCSHLGNVSMATVAPKYVTPLDEIPYSYRINYLWWGPMGLFITFAGGYLFSAALQRFLRPAPVKSELLAPVTRMLLRRNKTTDENEREEDEDEEKKKNEEIKSTGRDYENQVFELDDEMKGKPRN